MPKVILHSDRFSYRHAPVTPVLLVSLVTMFLPKAWLHFLHIDTQPTIPPLAPTPLISYHLYNFPPSIQLLHQPIPTTSNYTRLYLLPQTTSTSPEYTKLQPVLQTVTTPNHIY